MNERKFVNVAGTEEYVKLLSAFDCLTQEFYEDLFGYVIPDDTAFSSEIVQKTLYTALTTPYVFKLYNDLITTDGITRYGMGDTTIGFKLSKSCVEYLEINKKDKKHIRTFNGK